MAELVLIASYPKSGNTWVRTVFQGVLDPESAGDPNRLSLGEYGWDRRLLFDRHAPAEASELTAEEIECLLPAVYESLAAERRETAFVKVHDIPAPTSRGEWMFPTAAVRCVLYLVRHPYDVAVSFANHLGCSLEEVVERMGSAVPYLPQAEHMPLSLSERGASWSEHARQWLYAPLPYRVVAVRYEDLLREPQHGFRVLAEAAGQPTDERLTQAVEASEFARLQARERAAGFREKPKVSAAFFRQGGSMTWAGKLTEALRERIVREHGAMMERLGYRADGTADEPAERPDALLQL